MSVARSGPAWQAIMNEAANHPDEALDCLFDCQISLRSIHYCPEIRNKAFEANRILTDPQYKDMVSPANYLRYITELFIGCVESRAAEEALYLADLMTKICEADPKIRSTEEDIHHLRRIRRHHLLDAMTSTNNADSLDVFRRIDEVADEATKLSDPESRELAANTRLDALRARVIERIRQGQEWANHALDFFRGNLKDIMQHGCRRTQIDALTLKGRALIVRCSFEAGLDCAQEASEMSKAAKVVAIRTSEDTDQPFLCPNGLLGNQSPHRRDQYPLSMKDIEFIAAPVEEHFLTPSRNRARNPFEVNCVRHGYVYMELYCPGSHIPHRERWVRVGVAGALARRLCPDILIDERDGENWKNLVQGIERL